MLLAIGVLAVTIAAWRFGYQSGLRHSESSDLIDSRFVSLDELDSIASGRPILYQGSNKSFHYVRVDGIGYFRLSSSDVTIPLHDLRGDGSAALGMTLMTLKIENGKFRASDLPTGSF
jgi:hypothetical protein